MRNAEIWDLYDREGNKTGRDWERARHSEIPDGCYHIVCDILVRHICGDYLLMRRAYDKEPYPGYREASAGGSALKGETPLECAKRELLEETGICAGDFEQISTSVNDARHCIFYSYLAVVDCPKDSVTLQEGETVDYEWVDEEGLLAYLDADDAIRSHNNRYIKYYKELEAKRDAKR